MYNKNNNSPYYGDIVMATIGDINHSTKYSSSYNNNYIIIEVVDQFVTMEGGWRKAWKNKMTFDEYAAEETIHVLWTDILNHQEWFVQIGHSYRKRQPPHRSMKDYNVEV